jgi:hypothetical protein
VKLLSKRGAVAMARRPHRRTDRSRVDPAGVGRILAEDHRLNSMLGVWFYERNPFERSFT